MTEKYSHLTAGLALALLALPSAACDWEIASDKIDPMTDDRVCIISSESAQMAFGVRGETITFLTQSAYDSRDSLTVRIDENEAILIGEHRQTSMYRDNARRAMAEIKAGSRLRVSYRDYPNSRAGDAPICRLPELIASCQEPPTPPAN